MIKNNPFIKVIVILVALTGLGMTVIPSFLRFSGQISSEKVNLWMAIGMILWFITGTLWLGRKKDEEPLEEQIPEPLD